MSDRNDAERLQNDGPVDGTIYSLAMDLHQNFLRDLRRQAGEDIETFDEEMAARRQNYPYLLLGDIAMYVADVQLPANASPVDRSRGVIEAFRRIAQTPNLFEQITNTPYRRDQAELMTPPSPDSDELQEQTLTEASELRQKIISAGYLERAMIPDGRMVRLQYAASETIKVGRLSRRKLEPNTTLTISLIPDNLERTIKQYKKWNQYDGFEDYTGERKLRLPVFRLIAADGSHQLPPALNKIIGKKVRIGTVSRGTQLRIEHDIRHYVKELAGHERHTLSETLVLPAQLSQAYLGNSDQYPLL